MKRIYVGLLSEFYGITQQIPEDDRDALWAMVTYHGGQCQLNLNPNCTHLVIPRPSGVSTLDMYIYVNYIFNVCVTWCMFLVKNSLTYCTCKPY